MLVRIVGDTQSVFGILRQAIPDDPQIETEKAVAGDGVVLQPIPNAPRCRREERRRCCCRRRRFGGGRFSRGTHALHRVVLCHGIVPCSFAPL